jgi:hypothetical protein
MGRPPLRIGLVAFLSLVLPTTGCGPSYYPVKGKVMVGDKPAVGALVMFFPEGERPPKYTPPAATVGEDGTFTLSTGSKVGAPAGKYIVTVTWPAPPKKVSEKELAQGLGEDGPDQFNGKYATPDQSKLRAEVQTGETNLEPFNLTLPEPVNPKIGPKFGPKGPK